VRFGDNYVGPAWEFCVYCYSYFLLSPASKTPRDATTVGQIGIYETSRGSLSTRPPQREDADQRNGAKLTEDLTQRRYQTLNVVEISSMSLRRKAPQEQNYKNSTQFRYRSPPFTPRCLPKHYVFRRQDCLLFTEHAGLPESDLSTCLFLRFSSSASVRCLFFHPNRDAYRSYFRIGRCGHRPR
jgi:hypothetical protein